MVGQKEPIQGGIYTYYKFPGGERKYLVRAVAKREGDDAPEVVYQELFGNHDVHTCELGKFMGVHAMPDGKNAIPRFVFLRMATKDDLARIPGSQ